MRCGALRRLLILVSALGVMPVVLLLVGSRHYQELQNSGPPVKGLDVSLGSWGFSGMAWVSRMAVRMAARRAELRDACARTELDAPGNDSLHRPNPWEYLINTQHHLVWCNVFKAASTSWMYNFNILAGYTPEFLRDSKTVPLQLARQRYPRPALYVLKKALNSSISFLIVRHPLERLLSAYRDKLQFSLPHTHHQRLGSRIILKYRDFGKGSSIQAANRRYASPRWPTFSEFVHYLVDEHRAGHKFDMHWAPIAEFCTPCQLHFDVIAKFETLEEDQNYLIYRARLQDYIHPEWKNHARGRIATANLARSYYSQLTTREVMMLYDIYRYDFELFGYTLDGYIDQAMTSPTATGSPEKLPQETSTTTPSLRGKRRPHRGPRAPPH